MFLTKVTAAALTLLAAVCIAVVAVACQADPSAERSLSPEDVSIPREQLSDVLAAASDEERAVLRDGVLALAEYQAQMLSLVACARESGYVLAEEPVLPKWGGYALRFSRPVTTSAIDPAAAIQRSIDDCRRAHFDVVDKVWSDAHRPPEQLLQQARDALGECIRVAGIPSIPAHPAAGELLNPAKSADGRIDERFLRCSEQIATEFSLPGFAG